VFWKGGTQYLIIHISPVCDLSRLEPLCAEFDHDILPEMGTLGFLGLTIKGYGCAGVSHGAYGLIARSTLVIGRRCPFQSLLVMHPIHEFGSKVWKNKYLPRLCKYSE
jgi:glutaryl-CoA dehydrogenase